MPEYAMATAGVLVVAVALLVVLVGIRLHTRAKRRSTDVRDELSPEQRATLEEFVRR